jgi:VanZ family protein
VAVNFALAQLVIRFKEQLLSTSESWRSTPPSPELNGLGSQIPPRSLFPGWLRAWWPAMVWAVMIFFASTDSFSSEHTSRIIEPLLRWLIPGISAGSLELVHHLIRKSAHCVEYFIFFLFLYRGIRGMRKGWQWSSALYAWFLAAGYAVLDEIHQSFVASRGASPWDSLLDASAAFVAVFVVFLYYRLRRSSPL